MATCGYCGKEFYPGDGAWDNGDYMCGECIAHYIEQSGQLKPQAESKVEQEPGAEPPNK